MSPAPPRSYTHLLFDLDHTLYDTDVSLRRAFTDVLASTGRSDDEQHYVVFERINGALWRDVEAGLTTPSELHVRRFERLAAELDLSTPPSDLAAVFVDGLIHQGGLYEGAFDVLRQLTPSASSRTASVRSSGVGYAVSNSTISSTP